MGFLDDIWEKVKEATAYVAREGWEYTKNVARYEWTRWTATVPPDVQSILDATPETETPILPFRADTQVFLDLDYLYRYELNRNLEYLPGQIGSCNVRFKVTDQMRVYLDELADLKSGFLRSGRWGQDPGDEGRSCNPAMNKVVVSCALSPAVPVSWSSLSSHLSMQRPAQDLLGRRGSRSVSEHLPTVLRALICKVAGVKFFPKTVTL